MITPLSLQNQDTLEQLWRLQHIAYRLEAERIGFYQIPPLMDTLDTLRACGEQFYGRVDEEAEIIGAVAVEEGTDSICISRMMVHPDCFKQGIASSLMEYVLEQYNEVPLKVVSTGALNLPAVSLYQKYGFKPVSSEEIAPGVELITFHLNNM